MSVLVQNSVFIIDAMAFRRARDECFLAHWASKENLELVGVGVEEAHAKLVEKTDCRMMIYTLGDATPSSEKVLAEIRMLRALCPSAAFAITTDDSSLNSVISAVNVGVRGYLSNDLAPDVALQALSFVLHGGSYVPLHAMLAARPDGGAAHDRNGIQGIPESTVHREHGEISLFSGKPTKKGSFTECCARQQQAALPEELQVPVLRDGGHRNGVAISDISVGHPPHQMTDRQQAVLECLCQGLSNKVIGRQLNMTEMTVKVHVREIMRKLRVSNRTQVAIICSRNLPSVEPHEAATLSPEHPIWPS